MDIGTSVEVRNCAVEASTLALAARVVSANPDVCTPRTMMAGPVRARHARSRGGGGGGGGGALDSSPQAARSAAIVQTSSDTDSDVTRPLPTRDSAARDRPPLRNSYTVPTNKSRVG